MSPASPQRWRWDSPFNAAPCLTSGDFAVQGTAHRPRHQSHFRPARGEPPLEVLREEGWRGVATVFALMLLVRPLNVAVSLRRSPLPWREKLFASWIAPRGIVAASVASLFALALTDAGFSEGSRLLAITFLTIGLTVTLQGLTAAPLARLLRLHSLEGSRAIIVGAGPLGRGIAEVLRQHGRPVVLVDRNHGLIANALANGIEAVEGNALDEATLEAVGAEEAETLVAVTTNSEVNALAAHLAHDAFGIARAYPALGIRAAARALDSSTGSRQSRLRPAG